MSLKFVKKAAPQPEQQSEVETVEKPAPQSQSKSPGAGVKMSWMLKGSAAKSALAQEEAHAELLKQEAGRLWSYWMPEDSDRQVTFLDGDLDAEGMLDILMYRQHSVPLNGNWEQFVCTAQEDQSQPCPICASGDRPSLVGVMTIIDHNPHTIKKGPNQGKLIQNSRKLFIAKRNTIKILTKIAVKRGGLSGCTFDISRGGKNDPAVGSQFDFVQKYGKRSEIAAKFGLKEEEVQPANYAEEIRYRTPEQLIELGVGKAASGVGYEKGVGKLKDEL